MDQPIKKKWVNALLSGKYKQGKNALNHSRRYCCLGVAVKACDGRTPLNQGWLNPSDLRRFGFSERIQEELASLNDAGVPFDMIAGLIDEAL